MERPEHVLILREAVTTLARLGRLNARRLGIVSAPCHASQPMASRRSAARIEVCNATVTGSPQFQQEEKQKESNLTKAVSCLAW